MWCCSLVGCGHVVWGGVMWCGGVGSCGVVLWCDFTSIISQQYYFSTSTVKFLVSELRRLSFSRVLCVGVPRWGRGVESCEKVRERGRILRVPRWAKHVSPRWLLVHLVRLIVITLFIDEKERSPIAVDMYLYCHSVKRKRFAYLFKTLSLIDLRIRIKDHLTCERL